MTESIKHHARPETLAAYAAGALDEARAVVVATHLERCVSCRSAVRDFEALGGVCLEDIEPAVMSDGALERFWARAGAAAATAAPPSLIAHNDFSLAAARPLRTRLKGGVESVAWKSVAPGMAQAVIEADGYRKGSLRLLKISPGTRMPKHSHGAEELTLILEGAYEDELGVFRAGDLADLDGEATHSPCAIGDEDCICLIATSGPLAFKGLVGRVVQPFVGL